MIRYNSDLAKGLESGGLPFMMRVCPPSAHYYYHGGHVDDVFALLKISESVARYGLCSLRVMRRSFFT